MPEDRYLTTRQVAELPYVQLCYRTVAKHIRDGHLPALRNPVSGRWRVRLEDARAFYAPTAAPSSAIDAPNNARKRARSRGDS